MIWGVKNEEKNQGVNSVFISNFINKRKRNKSQGGKSSIVMNFGSK